MQRTRLLFVAFCAQAFCWWAAAAAETRPISLAEAIQLALEHNLEIQITRINPQMARLSLGGAYSAYDPTFSVEAGHSSSTSPGGFDPQFGQYPNSQRETDSFRLGVSGLLPTGTEYRLSGGQFSDQHGFNFVALESGQIVARNFEDSQGQVGISMTQPLLRDFWIDGARYNIAVRKKDLRISEYALEYQIMLVVTRVETAYYSLIAAIEQVKVEQQALQEAEQQLRENRKRVEVGVMAPLDEKDAESQVAASRANLLVAQSNLTIRQNTFKSLITDKYAQWGELALQPTETLSAVPATFSRQDSWTKALTARPDLVQARLEVEKKDIRLVYDRNQLYPQLDLTGSFGYFGSGNEFSGTFDEIASQRNPGYSFGAVLSIPLSNRQARYNYRTSKADRELALLQLKKKEQDIMVEIDDALAQAKSSLQQVEARREASKYAQAAYEAEQKKLENGKSTSFQVLMLQRILTSRRADEISALSEYNRSLADLALKEGSTLERNRISYAVKY